MSSLKRRLNVSKADVVKLKKAREQNDGEEEETALKPSENTTGTSSSLPEGFFDDPMKDASARCVTYVNPEEKEWSEFQKIISTESSKADEVLESDLIALQKERDLLEIESQMNNWARVEALSKRLEQLKEVKSKQTKDNCQLPAGASDVKSVTEESSDEDEDLDHLMNWRSKCKLR